MLAKTPFFRLLVPLILGIVLQYYFYVREWTIILSLIGALAMLVSFFISKQKQYTYRWLFGVGVFLFITAIGIATTSFSQKNTAFTFAEKEVSYRGKITDTPQQKPNSIACKVRLTDLNKNIVCYFQPSDLSADLKPGDEFFFYAKIQVIQNSGEPHSFDYAGYMYNKGFSGTAYIPSKRWEPIDSNSFSLTGEALAYRQKILNFYKSLNLSEHEFALLSALTLGYKDALSDDVKESFRATGVAHILAISGLHVGIIFGILNSLLFFLKRYPRYKWIGTLSIILLLWVYAFITGLSPSVVRACIMLSMLQISYLLHQRAFSYNTICLAAFAMLVFNPFLLFDLGFQFSFAAVLAIFFFQPLVNKRVVIKNKYLNYIWASFSLSCIAQLGTFPLCLYYFGTFPSYFFAVNIVIIPLATALIFAGISVLVLAPFALLIPSVSYIIYYMPAQAIKLIVWLMSQTISFFERLPFALIEDIHITFTDLVLLFTIILCGSFFITHRKARTLQVCLLAAILLIALRIPEQLYPKNELFIYKKSKAGIITWNIGKETFSIDSIGDYQVIDLQGKTLLAVTKDVWKKVEPDTKFDLDYLYISKSNSLSLYSLTHLFSIKSIIIDSSLSDKTRKRLKHECRDLGIPYHDMKQKGAFQAIF